MLNIMKQRVHWFSLCDLSIGFHLPRIEEVLRDFYPEKEIQDVNDVLELYEITKFVEQKVYPTSWGPEELDKVPHIKPIVAKYFMQITKLDLPNVYRAIDFSYRDTFWEIIDVFDVRGVIDENSLRDSFNETWELRELLHRERLVNKNGILLRKLLMSNPHTAEWLLDEYVADHRVGSHKQMFFPKQLTNEDVTQILEGYIDSDEPNINYVRLLKHTKIIHNTFKVSASTRLKAKKRLSY